MAILGWRYIIPDDNEEYGDNKTRVKLEAVTLFDNNRSGFSIKLTDSLVRKPEGKLYSFHAKNLSKHNFWE